MSISNSLLVECPSNPDSKILHKLALPNAVLTRHLFGKERMVENTQAMLICRNQYVSRCLKLCAERPDAAAL